MSAGSTHPDYASLVDPLFAFGGKRVAANCLSISHLIFMSIALKYPILAMRHFYNFSAPSLPLAEERGAKRSDGGVSRPGGHYRQCLVPRLDSLSRPSVGTALVAPLFGFGGKRITAIIFIFRTLQV